jgi:hypothetical protein
MTTLKEIKSWGYNRGYRIGGDCDLIDIGDYVDKYIMGESENVRVTTQNWFDVHTAIAYDCESGNREYSPFESLAHEINEYENKKGWSGDAWQEFDEAIGRGIRKALKERWKSIRMTKQDYAKSFDGSVDLFNAVWRKFIAYQSATGEPDINENIEVERLLESITSELVNNPSSRFYIYG